MGTVPMTIPPRIDLTWRWMSMAAAPDVPEKYPDLNTLPLPPPTGLTDLFDGVLPLLGALREQGTCWPMTTGKGKPPYWSGLRPYAWRRCLFDSSRTADESSGQTPSMMLHADEQFGVPPGVLMIDTTLRPADQRNASWRQHRREL